MSRAGTVRVDGGVLAYDVTGSGPAVVLIHGGFGDRRMWDQQVAVLAKHFRVVRYDLRGYGQSPAPTADYPALQDLLQLLDHLAIASATLVGNSMGGTLALDFTLVHPERVNALVLVASAPSGYAMPEADRELERTVSGVSRERGTKAAAELWLQNPMVAVTSHDPVAGLLLRRMVLENRSVWLTDFGRNDYPTPRALDRLREVRVPTLIVTGGEDTPANHAAARTLAQGMPRAESVVLREADHLPQMAAPLEFNRVLIDFLRVLR